MIKLCFDLARSNGLFPAAPSGQHFPKGKIGTVPVHMNLPSSIVYKCRSPLQRRFDAISKQIPACSIAAKRHCPVPQSISHSSKYCSRRDRRFRKKNMPKRPLKHDCILGQHPYSHPFCWLPQRVSIGFSANWISDREMSPACSCAANC